MLSQRLRCWPGIEAALGERLGVLVTFVTASVSLLQYTRFSHYGQGVWGCDEMGLLGGRGAVEIAMPPPAPEQEKAAAPAMKRRREQGKNNSAALVRYTTVTA